MAEANINIKSRNAKCCYSAFHNVTAMVGAAVLGFPYAMSQLGWLAFFLLKFLIFPFHSSTFENIDIFYVAPAFMIKRIFGV